MSKGMVLDLAAQRNRPGHLFCSLVIDVLSNHEE